MLLPFGDARRHEGPPGSPRLSAVCALLRRWAILCSLLVAAGAWFVLSGTGAGAQEAPPGAGDVVVESAPAAEAAPEPEVAAPDPAPVHESREQPAESAPAEAAPEPAAADGAGGAPAPEAGGEAPGGVADPAAGDAVQDAATADSGAGPDAGSALAQGVGTGDGAGAGAPAPQVVHLDVDGADAVTYRGPVQVDGISVPAFALPAGISGSRGEAMASMLAWLTQSFAGTGAAFVLDEPGPGSAYSTVYVGGGGDAFTGFGALWGVSEKVDRGNLDHADNAFVFSDNIASIAATAGEFGSDLARYVAHEVGHLLGFEHVYTPHSHDGGGVLDEVAFKPYTHVEVAKDVRADLLEDGLLTIKGECPVGPACPTGAFSNDYVVHPRILDALRKYPSFYYAGAVGPDGFPDITMGQRTVHPNDTGTWIARVFDMAWAAQSSARYTEVEKLQILAFSYGYATHAIGDVFAHTLVNEFAEGVFPAYADIVVGVGANDARELANALRHLMVEDYINQAAPRYDEDGERGLLPDGDLSNSSTSRIAFDAPVDFIYEALLKPFPGDPSAAADTGYLALDAIAASGGDPAKFRRAGGDFVRDGFAAGMQVFGFGFASAANNAKFTISAITASLVGGPMDTLDLLEDVVSETGSGDQALVTRGERGPILDLFYDVQRGLEEVQRQLITLSGPLVLPPGQSATEYLNELSLLVSALVLDGDGSTNPTAEQIEDLGKGYIASWIEAIDDGVRNWGALGLATSKALFDADNVRYWQNQQAANEGADVDHGRADAEGEVGIVDAMIRELDDPNHDGSTDDSFVNKYLGPMLGVPAFVSDITAVLGEVGELLDELVLPPFRLVLNPMKQALADVKAVVKDFLADIIKDRFGLDVEQFELLLRLGTKMDVKSVFGIPIFKPGDREKVDGYLGVVSHASPFELPLDLLPFVEFYEGASGGMHPDVEFDKERFAGFANSVTLAKMALLQEDDPLGVVPLEQLSLLARDGLAAVGTPMPAYDWGVLNMFGAHGGSILTTTLPKPSTAFTIDPALDVDDVADSIYLGPGHGLRTGDAVVYDPGGGAPLRYTHDASTYDLGRVTTQRTIDEGEQYKALREFYLVSVLAGDRVSLHFFHEDALSGVDVVDLEASAATGAAHTLVTRVVTNQEKLSFPDGFNVNAFEDAKVGDSLPWMRLIDGSNMWRENSLKVVDLFFRAHEGGGTGANKTVWTAALPAGSYRMGVTWEYNVTQRIHGEALAPATNAAYTVYDGITPLGTFHVDQRKFPTCFVDADFVTFDPLGADADDCEGADPDSIGQVFTISTGALRVELSDDADGHVVAGPVRVVPLGAPCPAPLTPSGCRIQRIVDPDTLAVAPGGQSETGSGWVDMFFPTGNGNLPLWESDTLRPVFRAFFDDWQNYGQDFPDLGDVTSTDPNVNPLIVPEYVPRPYLTPFDAPTPPETPAGVSTAIAAPGTYDYVGTTVLTGAVTAGDLTVNVAPATTGVTSIGIDLPTNSFTRSIGSFITDGFQAGQEIHATGFEWNNRSFVVVAVTIFALQVAQILFPGDSPTGDEELRSPGRLSIVGAVDVGGGDFEVHAEEVDVGPGVVLSTRARAGPDPVLSPSIGDSGDLALHAALIRVGAEAMLVAHVEAGSLFSGGDVILDADAVADVFFDFSLNSISLEGPEAAIEVGPGTWVLGRDVRMTADAASGSEAELEDALADAVATLARVVQRVGIVPGLLADFAALTGLTPLPSRILDVISDVTDAISGIAQVVEDAVSDGDLVDIDPAAVEGAYALATARIVIGDGALVHADRDILLSAHADSSAVRTTSGRYLSLSYANSRPMAEVAVHQGATLDAGRDVTASATTANLLDLRTEVSNAGDVVGFSLGFAKTRSIARTVVDVGAVVTAASAAFFSEALNTISNVAISSGFADSGLAGGGATIAAGYYQSQADTVVAGTVTTTGDLTLTARSVDISNVTRAFADIAAAPGPSHFLDSVNAWLDSIDLSFTIGDQTFDPLRGIDLEVPRLGITIGAAMTFVETENRAAALVHEGAKIAVGGDLTITGHAEARPKVSATSRAIAAPTPPAVAVGGSVVFAKFSNQATAFVGWIAQVDVDRDLRITAEALLTDDMALFDPNPALADVDSATGADRVGEEFDDANAVGAELATALAPVRTHLQSALGDPAAPMTSYVHTAAGASGSSAIGGGLSWIDIYNLAGAGIASGAAVNAGNALTADPDQDVVVDAFAHVDVTTVAGLESVLSFGGLSGPAGDAGVGGYFSSVWADNYARAYVDDLAHVVAADDVVVSSAVQSDVLNAVDTGAEANDVAVDGAFGLLVIGHESLAFIQDRASVSSDVVDVHAQDGSHVTHVAGGLATSPGVAVGVAAAFTIFAQPRALEDLAPAEAQADDDAEGIASFEAFMEALTGLPGQFAEEAPAMLGGSFVRAFIGDASSEMGPLGTGGDTGAVVAATAVTVAAESALEVWTVAVGGAESDANAGGGGGESTVRGLGYGFGVSGDVAFTSVEHTVEAYVRDVPVVRAPAVHLAATDTPLVVAMAGFLVFGTNFGIGGSFARVGLFAQTRAYTQDARIVTPDLDVLATATPRTFGFADGVGGTDQNLAVAGSVTLSNVLNVAEAAVGARSRVITSGAPLIKGRALLTGVANAGSAAEHSAPGFGSIGAALNLGDLVNDARAFVGADAMVNAGGDVRVEADADENLLTLAAAASQGTGTGQHSRLCTSAGGADPFAGGCVDATEDDLLTTSMALADLDGDGRLDLVVGSFGLAARRYLNDGGDFESCILWVFCSKTGEVLGDNWVGWADVILPQRLAGVVAPQLTLAVATLDADLDGDVDVITGNYAQANMLFLNDGEGDFGGGEGIPLGSSYLTTWLNPLDTGSFATAEELLLYVKRALRQMLLQAGVDPGDITAELVDEDGRNVVKFTSATRRLDAHWAEEALEAARVRGRLAQDVALTLVLNVDNQANAPPAQTTVSFTLLAADTAGFTSVAALRAYVQAKLDAALAAAGRAGGDVVVTVGADGAIGFAAAARDLGETGAAEGAIAAARSGPGNSQLSGDVAFTIPFGGTEIAVAVAAADTATNTTADDLVIDVNAAIVAALSVAGLSPGDVYAELDGADVVLDAVALSLDVPSATGATAAIGAKRLDGHLSGAGVDLIFRVTDVDDTTALAVGDVDHDGDPDVVVGNLFGRTRVLLNQRRIQLGALGLEPIKFTLVMTLNPLTTAPPIPIGTVDVEIDPLTTFDNIEPQDLLDDIRAAIDAALADHATLSVGDIAVRFDGGNIDVVSANMGLMVWGDGDAEERIEASRLWFGVGVDVGRSGGFVVDTVDERPPFDFSVDPDLVFSLMVTPPAPGAAPVTVNVALDPFDTQDNTSAAHLRADLQAAVDAALVAAGLPAGAVVVDFHTAGFVVFLGALGHGVSGDLAASDAVESHRRYYEIDEDLTTSVALADLNGDGKPDLVVGKVGIDLGKLIERGVLKLGDLVEGVAASVAQVVGAGLAALVDLLDAGLVDAFDFAPGASVVLRDLVDLGVVSLADLAAAGLAGVDDLVAGLTVAVDAAGGLLDRGLVTAQELAAVGLPLTGDVTVADLVASGLVTLEDLAGEGLVTVDDLASGAATTLREIVNSGIVAIRDLLDAALVGLDDLLDGVLVDVRDLVRSGLVSLVELVDANLLKPNGVDLRKLDPQSILQNFSVGAPTQIYLNVDDWVLADSFEGFAAPVELEWRITKALAVGDVDNDDDVDVVTGNILSPVRVHLNDGNAHFTSADVGSDARLLTSIALADVNGDGSLDVVTGNLFARNRLYLNNDDGSGTFAPGSDVGTDQYATTAIVAGDLDGDGNADVVAGNSLPSIAVAGSVNSVTVTDKAHAEIGDGALVITASDVTVLADGRTEVVALAGAAAAGDEISIGASLTNTNLRRDVVAAVDGAVVITLGPGSSVTVDAEAGDLLISFAGGSGSAGDLGVVASAVLNTMQDLTQAYVTGGARIVTPDLVVRARHESTVIGVAGALAGSLAGVVVGAAADLEFLDKTVQAWIGAATIDVVHDVLVDAAAVDAIMSFVAGLGSSLALAIAGSASVVSLDNTTLAYIEGDPEEGATIRAGDNVIVQADSDLDVGTWAGAATFTFLVGVGLAASITFHKDDTRAWIGRYSNVKALGTNASPVRTEIRGLSSPMRGVAVTATSHEEFSPVSAGAGMAGLVGVAGSLNLVAADEGTRAFIGQGARVEKFTAGPLPHGDQVVYVLAIDWTEAFGIAGALDLSLVAGVGAGVDAATITKTTEAFISGEVGADPALGETDTNKVVAVIARSYEDLTSFSASLTAAGIAGVGANLGIYAVAATTRAFVGPNAWVRARGNVVVSAHHDDEIDVLAGQATAALGAAVGAAGAAVHTRNTTEAFIAAGATVTALAQIAGLVAPTGGLEESSLLEDVINAAFGGGAFAALTGAVDFIVNNPVAQVARSALGSVFSILVTPVDFPSFDTTLVNPRHVSPAYAELRGVSVTATNTDDVEMLTVGADAAFLGAVEGSMSAYVSGDLTAAYTGDGASVNADPTGVDAAQDVVIAASSDTSFMAISGALSVSGIAGVGASASAGMIRNLTSAGVGPDSVVRARDEVKVLASATQKVLPIAAGFAFSSGAVIIPLLGIPVAGSLPVVSINSQTFAFVDHDATVEAGSNVEVRARDDSNVDTVAGAGAFATGGGYSIGLGASAAFIVVRKDTRAWIGEGAVVDARAGGATVSVLTGTVAGEDLEFEDVRGVVVQAISTQDIFPLTAAGGDFTGGVTSFDLGFSGVLNFTVVEAHTTAFIDRGARVNMAPGAEAAAQTVSVGAGDDTKIYGVAVNLVKTDLGIAGGIDMGVVNNDILAEIRPGATVAAERDVTVHAVSTIETDSFVSGVGKTEKASLMVSWSLYGIRSAFPSPLPFDVDAVSEFVGKLTNPATGQGVQAFLEGSVAYLLGKLGGGLGGKLREASSVIGAAGAVSTALDTSLPATGASGAEGAALYFDVADVDDGLDTIRLDPAHWLRTGDAVAYAAEKLVQIDGPDSLLDPDSQSSSETPLVTVADLVAAGLPTSGRVSLGTLLDSGVLVSVQGLKDATLVTDTALANAGLPTTGSIAIGDLVFARLVTQDKLAAAGVIRDPAPIGGLEFGEVYYVGLDPGDPTVAKLYATRTDALAGTGALGLDPAAAAGNRHSFTVTALLGFGAADVDATADTVDLGDSHGLQTGDAVHYSADPDRDTVYQIDGPGGLLDIGAVTADQLTDKGLPTSGQITLGTLLAKEVVTPDKVGVGGLAQGGTYFVRVHPLDSSKVTLHATRTAAFAGGQAIDLVLPVLPGAAFHLDAASFGASAVIDGATVSAGRDVVVSAVEFVDVASDTSWTFNFEASDAWIAMAMDKGTLGLSSAADAGVVGGANVTAGRHVRITGDVDTHSQIMAGSALTNESDRSLAYVEGPGTVVVAQAGDVVVEACLEFDSIYAAIIPFTSQGGIGDSGGDMKSSTVLTQNYVDAHVGESSVSAAGGVRVAATDDGEVWAVADAVTVKDKGALDLVAYGITMADATITDAVFAYVVGSAVTADGGDVDVLALFDVNVVSISVGIAVQENPIGLAGSLIMNKVVSAVVAFVAGDSDVSASGAVNVHATDDTDLISFGGAANGQSQLSIGVALGFNDIANTVRAYVTGSKVAALGGDVSILAEAVPVVTVITVGLAQAEEQQQVDQMQNNGVGGAIKYALFRIVEFFATLTVADRDNGNAMAGSISFNSIKSVVEAYIGEDAAGGADVDASGSVTVSAVDGPTIVAVAGAAGWADGTAKGAAVSVNTIQDAIRAWVDGAQTTVDAAVVEVRADNNADITAVTIGGTNADTFSLAGSFSKNSMHDTLDAAVTGGAAVTGVASVTVHATDDATIVAVAGSLAYSSDAVAVGAAVSLNDLKETVTARVDDATLQAPAILVEAVADGDVTAITIGGSGAEDFSLGGSFSYNKTENTVEARVTGGAVLTATGGIVHVYASDDTDIEADGGGAGIVYDDNGTNAGAAIGFSVAINEVTNAVRSTVDASTIDASVVEIKAASTASIHALTIAGGGTYSGSGGGSGFDFVGAGAVSVNTVKITVEALVQNGATVTATTSVLVEANDDTWVRADGGAAALFLSDSSQSGGLTIELGVGVATNSIENQIHACADDATLTAPTVTIKAIADNDVNALALGIAGGLSFGSGGGASFGGAGSGAGNTVANTVHAKAGGGAVIAAAALNVAATDSTDIRADAGGVAFLFSRGPPSIAVGISVSSNKVTNTTTAEITGAADVDTAVLTIHAKSDSTAGAVTIPGAGTASSGSGNGFQFAGAGAGSRNEIRNSIMARLQTSVAVNLSGLAVSTVKAEDLSVIDADAAGVAPPGPRPRRPARPRGGGGGGPPPPPPPRRPPRLGQPQRRPGHHSGRGDRHQRHRQHHSGRHRLHGRACRRRSRRDRPLRRHDRRAHDRPGRFALGVEQRRLLLRRRRVRFRQRDRRLDDRAGHRRHPRRRRRRHGAGRRHVRGQRRRRSRCHRCRDGRICRRRRGHVRGDQQDPQQRRCHGGPLEHRHLRRPCRGARGRGDLRRVHRGPCRDRHRNRRRRLRHRSRGRGRCRGGQLDSGERDGERRRRLEHLRRFRAAAGEQLLDQWRAASQCARLRLGQVRDRRRRRVRRGGRGGGQRRLRRRAGRRLRLQRDRHGDAGCDRRFRRQHDGRSARGGQLECQDRCRRRGPHGERRRRFRRRVLPRRCRIGGE